MTYASIFIIGLFYFIRNSYSHNEGKWMYLFAILALLPKFESQIRQYIAFPFILCAITCLYSKNKWITGLIFVVIANYIHSGAIAIVPFLCVSYFLIKKTISWKFLVAIFFCSYYIIPTGYLSDFIIKILTSLKLD